MLNSYDQFVECVERFGVVAFHGNVPQGFPNLQEMTAEAQWHTGLAESDPWQWKDRCAKEKKLAFGCLLGGSKGFVAGRLYPYFYKANRPRYTPRERFEEGTVSRTLLGVYELFTPGAELDTGEIRRQMGVTKKGGASRVDGAVTQLQKEFLITVCGNRRKRNKEGGEYGWPANTYCRVEDWQPDWLAGEEDMDRDDAMDYILEHCAAWDRGVDSARLRRLLFGKG